jgi:radical SAM superfamily enzyme YgiQ (UPF0313 family)
MYGLPGEKDEDIEAILSLVEKTLAALGAGDSLFLSINPFIPKPQTPEAGHRLYPLRYYEDVRSRVNAGLQGRRRVTPRFESLRHIALQYALSLGGVETGEEVCRAVESRHLGEFVRLLEKDMERNDGP